MILCLNKCGHQAQQLTEEIYEELESGSEESWLKPIKDDRKMSMAEAMAQRNADKLNAFIDNSEGACDERALDEPRY